MVGGLGCLFCFLLPVLKDYLSCVGNCSSFARLAFVRSGLCALQMCCNVRWVVRDFALNVLSVEGERNFKIGLQPTGVCEKTPFAL